MGMIGYFAEIDSEKINQLLESTEKPLMDNIHDTLSGLRRLDIDKRWDFYTLGCQAPLLLIPRRMIR